MDLSDYAVVLFLSICAVVIIGTVLKAALKKASEDEQKPSRPNLHTEPRTLQNHFPATRPTPVQSTQPKRSKPAKRIVPCPDCSRPVALAKLQRHRAQAHGTVRRCLLCNKYVRPDNIAWHNLKQHHRSATDYLRPTALPCPRCHNSVLLKNVTKHLRRIHEYDFATSNGRHPFLTAIEYERDEFCIVDGLNIVRMRGQDLPRLDYLLALTYRMLQDDVDFLCVFDASAPAAIREFQGSVFSKFYDYLIQSHPRRFSQVPSGTVADEFILDIAVMFGQHIITNDLYRDHVARHPWLETQREQRLARVALKYSPKLHREVLFWNDRKILTPSPHKIRTFFKTYKDLLSERDKGRAPDLCR